LGFVVDSLAADVVVLKLDAVHEGQLRQGLEYELFFFLRSKETLTFDLKSNLSSFKPGMLTRPSIASPTSWNALSLRSRYLSFLSFERSFGNRVKLFPLSDNLSETGYQLQVRVVLDFFGHLLPVLVIPA
jgi:hypothetical protein